jgi:hypothetical protein
MFFVIDCIAIDSDLPQRCLERVHGSYGLRRINGQPTFPEQFFQLIIRVVSDQCLSLRRAMHIDVPSYPGPASGIVR